MKQNDHIGGEQPTAQEVEKFTSVPAATIQPKTTRTMLYFAIWISFVAWIANFDQSFQGAVLIMPSYNKAFGTCVQTPNPATGGMTEVCSLSPMQQSLISIGTLFYAVGAALTGVAGAWIGRRGVIQVCCALLIIAAASMMGTTGSFLNYMVCKCIGGIGTGGLQTIAVTYGSECTAPHRRGLLMGLFNIGLGFGNASAALVCYGTSHIAATSDWQWRAPIFCQIPLTLTLGLGTLLFHESPRWLMVKGREEKARKAFASYYREAPDSALVNAQMDDLIRHIAHERAILSSSSWIEIFGKKNIRRTLVSLLILVSLAITGIQFVGYYTALFFADIGVDDPFLINIIIALCILAGALPSPFAVEFLGRRWSLLSGYILMAVLMLIFSTVSTCLGAGNVVARDVVVGLMCIWAFVFGSLIGPCVFPASAEMHSIRLRTYGQANTGMIYNIFAFGATFWTPYMLNPAYGDMGTTVGYFYFAITFVMIVLIFFFVPETARLSLEQIDDYFDSDVPAWKTSLARNIKLGHTLPEEVE